MTPVASSSSAWCGLVDEVLDATGVGVAVVDRALRCTWANPTFDRLLEHEPGWCAGRSAQEVLGATWPTAEEALWHGFTAPVTSLRTLLGVAPSRRGAAGATGASTGAALALETRPWRDPADPTGAVRAVVVVVRPRASLAEAGRAWGDAERRYRLLAEQTTEVVVVLDEDGTIRYASPSTRSVLGYDPDELVGRKQLPVVDQQQRAALVGPHREAALGEPVVSVVRVRRGDGRVRWVECTTRHLEGDDGTPASYHVTARDVTARMRAQTLVDVSSAIDRVLLEDPDLDRCLQVACEGLAELVDCAATAVWLVDAEGRPATAALAGPQAEGLRAATTGRAEGDDSDDEDPLVHVVRTGDDLVLADVTAVGSARWRRAAQAARLGAGVLVPLLDPADGGPVLGVLGFLSHHGEPVDDAIALRLATIAQRLAVARRLVADREQLEEQRTALAEANAQLERRVAERTADLDAVVAELETFTYSVSHDLRAPLRTIRTFVDIIAEDQHERLDEHGRSDLELVGRNVDQLAEMVDALLELARVTGADFERLPVDLVPQALEIAAQLQRADPTRAVRLVVPDEPAVVHADPRLTRVLLTNLLANAWKFTGTRPDPVVELRRADGPVPAFGVADNGVGFDPAHAHRLFVAFQRLHRAEDFPGTGVGLATVARVCRRHGGRVWAEGTPGSGACFWFTLEPEEGTGR